MGKVVEQSINRHLILTLLAAVTIVLTTQGVLCADVPPALSDTHPSILIGSSATRFVAMPNEAFFQQ